MRKSQRNHHGEKHFNQKEQDGEDNEIKERSVCKKQPVVLEFSAVSKVRMVSDESGDIEEVTQKLVSQIRKCGEFSWCNEKSLSILKHRIV